MLKYNSKTDGAHWNEDEFPFANESFIYDNSKLKKLGIKLTPLLKGLKNDYETYYKKNL